MHYIMHVIIICTHFNQAQQINHASVHAYVTSHTCIAAHDRRNYTQERL
jgi:hypothetical protein